MPRCPTILILWASTLALLYACPASAEARGTPTAQQLDDSLEVHLTAVGLLPDAQQLRQLRHSAATARRTGRVGAEIELLRAMSRPYRRLDSLRRSFGTLYDAVELAERFDSSKLPRLHTELAANYLDYDDFDGAIEQLLRARQLALHLADRPAATRALHALIEVHAELGDRERAAQYARAYFDEVMLREIDHPEQRLRAFQVLGMAAAFEQRGEVARGYFEEAYQIAKHDLGEEAIVQSVYGRLKAAPNVYSPRQRLRTAKFLRTQPDQHLSAAQRTGVALAEIEALLDLRRYATARDSLSGIRRQGDGALEEWRLTLLERASVALEDFGGAYYARLHHDKLDAQRRARRQEGRVAAAEARFSLDEYRATLAALERTSAEQLDRLARSDALSFVALLALVLTLIALSVTYQEKVRRSQAEERLQGMVSERTADLQARNRELERFNTALSHDLKEPLRSVVSFSELAARSIGDHPAREYLDHVEASGRQLHDLVGGILDFQRGGGGGAHERCDLADVAQDALARTRERFPARPIHLAAIDLPTVSLPAELAREALEIAFANAARFNDADRVDVSVQYVGEGRQHRLLVVDNGIGIPAEYHEKVFELFGRLHPREQYGGAGLGLARLRKRMREIGGLVRVARSVVGEGTAIELAWGGHGQPDGHAAAEVLGVGGASTPGER